MSLRSKLLLIAVLLLFLGSSCSLEEPALEGWVYWLEESQFLVVSGIESVDIPYDEWFDSGDHAAIVFTVVPLNRFRVTDCYGGLDDLKVGSRVRAWAAGDIARSYPGLATAARVEILKEQ